MDTVKINCKDCGRYLATVGASFANEHRNRICDKCARDYKKNSTAHYIAKDGRAGTITATGAWKPAV